MSYVIVLDFGYTENRQARSSIHDLAACTVEQFSKRDDVIVLAQSETYAQLRRRGFPTARLAKIEVGQSDTNGTSGGGSYHVLKRAKEMMIERELVDRGVESSSFLAIVVAHQAHVKRAVRQGRLFDLKLIPGKDLPKKFYADAEQWWCRRKLFRYLREIPGYWMLKMAGQI